GIYPENRIIQAMDIALRFLQKQEYNPLIRIAVFHYLFAYIHPFYDGNGRMTRFISSYFLSRELCPLVGLKLSSAIKAEQSKYNKLFKETNEKRNMGDLTGFILGFLRFVSKSIDEIYDFLTETKVLWERTKRILSKHHKIPKRNDALLILCQNALFSESGLTIHDLVQITGKSRSTIDHELDIYVKDWKVLNAARKGRWIVYRLDMNKLLDYLSQDSDDM
ncbi:MAG: Fic family protein, partial [Clostridia bacterium]|nr:Fic family protein [Clostridia bacterium]